MSAQLQSLPIGIQSFELLRHQGNLYVDKTAKLMRLIADSARVFLSRPRRFGKSLTLSTLDAMFGGRAELFRGLAAEAWVAEQAKHPSPVLRLDMSRLRPYSSAQELDCSILSELRDFVRDHDFDLAGEASGAGML